MKIDKNTSLTELITTSKLLGKARINLNVMDLPPNDSLWDVYNKYRSHQDRIDDIIQGKIESLEIDCPVDWIGKSE